MLALKNDRTHCAKQLRDMYMYFLRIGVKKVIKIKQDHMDRRATIYRQSKHDFQEGTVQAPSMKARMVLQY